MLILVLSRFLVYPIANMENEKLFERIIDSSKNDIRERSDAHIPRKNIPLHRWLITVTCALVILGTTIFTNNPWWTISQIEVDSEDTWNDNSEFEWTKVNYAFHFSFYLAQILLS